jgi:hypothetical protein
MGISPKGLVDVRDFIVEMACLQGTKVLSIHNQITVKTGEVALGVPSKKDDADFDVACRVLSVICSFYTLKY